MNSVHLVGRLTQDPEVKQLTGAKVSNFSIATNESYKDKSDKWVEVVEYHSLTAWRGLEWLKKGELVAVEGKLSTTKHDGKYYTKIIVRSIHRLVKPT